MNKLAALMLAICTLASCQRDHEIKVSLRNGLPHFSFDPPASVSEIEVTAIAQQPRTVWKLVMSGANGPNLHELNYGQVPRGLAQITKPEPFKPGQLYRVDVSASDGLGKQYFVASDDAVSPGDVEVLSLH